MLDMMYATHTGAEKMTARIYQDGDEVVRVIPEGHILHDGFIDGQQVERFWVPDLGSNGLTKDAFVRWVIHGQPGQFGQQVCEGLNRRGKYPDGKPRIPD